MTAKRECSSQKAAPVPSALDYIILGRERGDGGRKKRKLLMFNGALPSHDARFYAQLADLEPMPQAEGGAGPALALLDFDGARMLLASIQPAAEGPTDFVEHYVFMPVVTLAESATQLERWRAFLPEASDDLQRTLPLLQAPDFAPIDAQTRAAILQRFLDELPAGGFEQALALLGALIHERRLAIAGFPAELSRRMEIVAGLQALLPGPLAARLTFASQAPAKCQHRPHLVFADEPAEAEAWRCDWSEPKLSADVFDHPYLDALRELWRGDAAAMAAEVHRLGPLAITDLGGGELGLALERIAERFWLDRQALSLDGDVDTASIIEILDGATPPLQDSRRGYIKKLLQNALSQRDRAAGTRVAEELDKDRSLESALSQIFDEMLEDQPDAVYVFIRNRLMHLGVDDAWIPRLQNAARLSLEVAIDQGDVGALAGWLELIAHEPQAWQLNAILEEAILRAKQRAYADGELGIHLILIAVRRAPDIVDALYEDQQLIEALETKVQVALQSPSAEALEPLIHEKREHFLLALVHGIEVSDDLLVTAPTAKALWALYESDQRIDLPAVFRPPAVTRLLMTEASHQMSEEALDFLFKRVIAGDDRKLIVDAARHYAERDQLFPRLGGALENDALSLDKVISVMNAISAIKSAPPQEVIDTYFALLDYYQWEAQTQRLMEALTRLLAKHDEAQASYRHLWRLFEACCQSESDGATRVSMTHLLLQYAQEEDLSIVVEGLARIWRRIGLNKALQQAVNAWWRNYTHSSSLTQLARLERELEAQRHLEAQKHILNSVLAMRRWLHNQDPVELADAINTTYTILEHFTDAFDAEHIHEIDSHTIRRELDEVGGGLSSEARHILANNLRNLAHRITQMAEKRSKPSLIRSEEGIERQLQQGEANPQGSIDMMKWIAGYLDGAHQQSDD